MKPRSVFRAVVLFAFGLVSGLSAGSRTAQWKKVEEAGAKGLPKTAIEALEPIIRDAIADKAYAEAIKAIGRKITFQGKIEGNKAEEQVVRMQAELEKAPAEMKPAMEAILAHWYWQYFQQNRWRFMQRTQMGSASGPDLQTWDLARILTEIDRHFSAALADEKTLKATPVGDYDELLVRGDVPDVYRPTMFDFLAHEALQFYQTGEHAAVQSEDTFEADASGPIFAGATEFVGWHPISSDDTSPVFKAIGLFQALLKFHADDSDRSAFYDADLGRISYAHNASVGENKEESYKAALLKFAEITARHEISSRALALLATQLNQEGNPAEAHKLAQRGVDAFPKSAGGAMCFNLIQQIETKSAQLDTEHVWNAPWPTLNVTYQNITKVHFRAVPMQFETHLSERRWGLGNLDDQQRQHLLAVSPALEWSADLPATKDYKSRTEQLPAPTSLKPGFYFILASFDPAFRENENLISATSVWVSELAVVLQSRYDGNSQNGFVLNANGGTPVADATIRIFQRDRNGWFKQDKVVQSDKDGRFQFASSENNSAVLLVEREGQAISSEREINFYGNRGRDRAVSQTVFFTDRALYRPGQTINYKGICIQADQSRANYKTMARERVGVIFRDPNGKEIARATLQTNDYGSFNGSFTAPRDRALGYMTLAVDGSPAGTTGIRVEEYKRPKFQVELSAPTEAAKLDAAVTLTGKATAYTGASIGGAKVKWRIERGVQFPSWCWWWQPPETKAIAHGTATTETDGTFKVQFTAEPDRAIPAKNEPVFSFTLTADVTDTTGETRSENKIVRAGYTALQASLNTDAWQTADKPVEITIETKSLDDVSQAAEGVLVIHALQQPAKVERAPLQATERYYRGRNNDDAPPKNDPSNPDSWELADVVARRDFKTDGSGKTQIIAPLKAGIYRASLETKDRFGKTVTARQTLQVVEPRGQHYGIKLPNIFSSPKWSVEPGETFSALWGTGYSAGRAFVELLCDGRKLKSYWTGDNRTQELIELPVTEEMRGGLTLRVTYIRENRAYLNQRTVDVPWSNKRLGLKWESFRSKLLPGQKETWTAIVTGPDSKRTAAEMVAALYDASLDQFAPHQWQEQFNVFRRENNWVNSQFLNGQSPFQFIYHGLENHSRDAAWNYRRFPGEIVEGIWGNSEMVTLSAFETRGGSARSTLAGSRVRAELKDTGAAMMAVGAASPAPMTPDAASAGHIAPGQTAEPSPDLTQVTARKNLNETAFFFPQLLADENGVVKMVFTMPEALTQWKFLGFAHDKELRSGFLTDKVVTAKDIMIEPNPPRFVREGDAIEFTVKVSNQTDQSQSGAVKLTFADAASLQSVDGVLGNQVIEKKFAVPAKQSRSFSWRINVPDGIGFLTYKAVGATASASDGEEGFLPVLSRRILVTESLPLPIRGKSTKQFDFKKLIESGKSDTLRHESLTVQMVSQPAWYAVMALPYLMEYPYECSEQIFNRFYANSLARHIAASDPKIRRIFDQWKNTTALDSPLEKNEDLKSLTLEETPWLRQANKESESRRNVGILFDANRLDDESSRTLAKLSERQLSDGLWSWFPGGRSSEYISLYVTTGFGRLRHLGVDVDISPALKSLEALDAWMEEHYRMILKSKSPEKYVPNYIDAFYLYGRSFFLKDRPIAKEHQAAVDFFLRQSRKFWLQIDCRQSQAHLALALQRFGDNQTPSDIMKSLKERSVASEELGMFWRDQELSWWWYRAPIETQAMMIEAFAEVSRDTQAVEDCKVWLLKQKQTQDWKTTKATADAIYGLLLQGDNLLSSDALVEVALGGETIKPEKVEAGTGFYEQKFIRNEIKPAMGEITVKKVDDGVSWGSVHWQYLEDMSKVTPHEGTPLRLKKTLFIKETTAKGQVLKPVNGPISVGDELVVRIELRTDRDMEYVHLKDQRGSGTEPVNVLSRYKYQDGLAYYESTRDTASHFFIDYLPKGTYVFEYSTRVQLKGNYQSGIAEIQCMYAPEFNSHSESFALEVK